MSKIVVAALYKFARLEDFEALREPLLDCCIAAGVKGTLLLAREGINGTIAGSREGIDRVLAYLRGDPRLSDLEHKESFDGSIHVGEDHSVNRDRFTNHVSAFSDSHRGGGQ